MNNVKYVGMDVHKAITVIAVLNVHGQMESHTKIKTKAANICDFFRGLSGQVEVVFEEGTHSAWLYKLLKPLVASVTVCDPRRNKLIEDGNKSDDEDAETLAQLLRLGSVRAVYKVGREGKALLESNLSARPMAGNNREHLHRQVLPFPDCFLPPKRKNS